MAMISGFFNSINGDRKYKADFFSEYFASFIGNGVYPNPSSNFQVMSNNDMTVTLLPGKAWIEGVYCRDHLNFIIPIQVADGVLNRIDRVVLRVDAADRKGKVVVKKSTFSSNPVAPSLQRDEYAYELGIADIYVSKGAISITQANITDLRLNNNLCGMVHGVVDQVDTTTIFNQYLSWFQQKEIEFNTDLVDYKTTKQGEIDLIQQQFQNDFDSWFITIKDILDTNVAGNLLTKIEEVREEINNRNLPLNAKTYNEVSQWSDILIPDQLRGKALLEFLLNDENSSLQIANSEQAMLIIMQEERFDKARQVPFDYEQIICKLGQKTDVGQYLSWVEELLSNSTRGIEKLELGLMLESGNLEIVSNEYAIRTIMNGEQLKGLCDYRVKFASENNLDTEVKRLDNRINGVVV